MPTKPVINNNVFNYEKSDFPKLTDAQLDNLNKIKIIFGDITKVPCDAIVNSASPNLLGGKGVDGAIHEAAGPKLKQECATLNGCATGEAKITKGYKLHCKYIIHTVGPVYDKNQRDNNSEKLHNCYHNSLKLADEHKVKTITFPAISTGIFGFPTRLALPIVFNTITQTLNECNYINQVNLICHNPINYAAYTSYMNELIKYNKKNTK